MERFSDPLNLQYIDGRRWLITTSFRFHLVSADGPEFVLVGAGEITDFASIPRPLKVFWPSPGSVFDRPATVHDSLYIYPYVHHDDGSLRRIDREEADQIFVEAMTVTKTDRWTRYILHAGVRAGGGGIWAGHRRKEVEQLEAALLAQWWIDNPWTGEMEATA